MAKPLTLWLVPSFSQHNLRLVASGRCLHVSVTKFQDEFASLRQVNSPYTWNKFEICGTDMYLIRFLLNFTVLCLLLWISRLRDHAKCITSPELRHLHYRNWRLKICISRLYVSSWSPKGDLRIFLISSPAQRQGGRGWEQEWYDTSTRKDNTCKMTWPLNEHCKIAGALKKP